MHSAIMSDDSTALLFRRFSYHCVKKCPYSELFWSVSSRIWTEYGEMRSISQSKCGKIRTRLAPNTDTFNAVYIYIFNILRVAYARPEDKKKETSEGSNFSVTKNKMETDR